MNELEPLGLIWNAIGQVLARIITLMMWLFVVGLVVLTVAIVVTQAQPMLWPTASGVVTADGESVSYAVRGREFITEVRGLTDPSTPVVIYYNPLRPASILLERGFELPSPVEVPWLSYAGIGGVVVTVLGFLLCVSGRIDREGYIIAFRGASGLFIICTGGALTTVIVLALWVGFEPAYVRTFVGLAAGTAAGVATLLILGPYATFKEWMAALKEEG